MSLLVLPPESAIYRALSRLLVEADYVFFAGLPGAGKSLLLQQLALMALADRRQVTLLQWDVARQAFESPRFPLANGATHPLVIQATGLWLRGALAAWEAAREPAVDLLIGEVPLIGGRMMEIARPAADEAEALLRHERTQFLIPVPSRRVRARIEARRAATIANPQHDNEAHDAPPDLLRALWQELLQVAAALGLGTPSAQDAPYSPDVYAALYRHLLRHRNAQVLPIEQTLRPGQSVYALDAELPSLQASAAEARSILAQLESSMTLAQVLAAAANWHEV
ncbi:MAG: hypothetical protein OXG85_12635 [Chloroflexi bacterium]|nr:hypothetical protein [Chloroflexota bacterium]